MSVTVVRPDLMEPAVRIDLAPARPPRVRSLRGPVARQSQPIRALRPVQPDAPAPRLASSVAVPTTAPVPASSGWRLTDRARVLIAGLFAAVMVTGLGVVVGGFLAVDDGPVGGAEAPVVAGHGA